LNGAGQNSLLRGAIIRMTVLLLVSGTIAFGWEAFKNAEALRLEGLVVRVQAVPAGRGGDSQAFTIRYAFQGRDHVIVLRRGILDALGRLHHLQPGDRVPLAVDPQSPQRATLDTLSARYGVTLCFIVLGGIFALVAAAVGLRRRRFP
jgi:hypothetical protein